MVSQEMKIRKVVVTVEETYMDAEKNLDKPARKVLAAAVIDNPYAGTYTQDLQLLFDFGERLGSLLTKKALEALGSGPDQATELIDSYGKGAIVGESGELEHAHAILHPKLGSPLRSALGGVDYCKAIIPSAAKVATVGATLDVPLHYKRAAFVRSHYDSMEARIPDSPKPNEILIAIALTDSGRPLARIGGLQKQEIKGLDGLR